LTTSQIPLSSTALATELDGDRSGITSAIADDLAYRKLLIVNVVFIGLKGAGDGNWFSLTPACRVRRQRSGPPRKPGLEIAADLHASS
jgi:hypothetical protein